jgi:hypothetical protein
MAFVVVSFGIAIGALLAAAFVIMYVRIDSVRPEALTLLPPAMRSPRCRWCRR